MNLVPRALAKGRGVSQEFRARRSWFSNHVESRSLAGTVERGEIDEIVPAEREAEGFGFGDSLRWSENLMEYVVVS